MDILHKRRMQQMMESALQKKMSKGRNFFGGGGQHQLKPTTTMSSSLPTAAESSAFNERSRDRASYGDRWNQHMKHSRRGFKREELGVKQQKNVAGAMRDARNDDRAERELQRKIAADKVKAAGGGFGVGAPPGTQVATPKARGGVPLGTQPQPAVQPQSGQAPVVSKPESGGPYSFERNGKIEKGSLPGEYAPRWRHGAQVVAPGQQAAQATPNMPAPVDPQAMNGMGNNISIPGVQPPPKPWTPGAPTPTIKLGKPVGNAQQAAIPSMAPIYRAGARGQDVIARKMIKRAKKGPFTRGVPQSVARQKKVVDWLRNKVPQNMPFTRNYRGKSYTKFDF
jgi:hypothetical protein